MRTTLCFFTGDEIELKIPIVQTDGNDSNETDRIFKRFVCIASKNFEQFFRLYLPTFDLLFVAIIPFLLMIFANIGIIRKTMRSNILCVSSRKQKRNNRLTIMLLSVILAFILLTCPSVTYICLNRLMSSKTFSDTKLVVLDLLEALWYTKHALNFILYTLSGQDFRREFRKLISCASRTTLGTLQGQQRHQHSNSMSMQSYASSYRASSIRSRSTHRLSKGLQLPGLHLTAITYPSAADDRCMHDANSSAVVGFINGRSPSATPGSSNRTSGDVLVFL